VPWRAQLCVKLMVPIHASPARSVGALEVVPEPRGQPMAAGHDLRRGLAEVGNRPAQEVAALRDRTVVVARRVAVAIDPQLDQRAVPAVPRHEVPAAGGMRDAAAAASGEQHERERQQRAVHEHAQPQHPAARAAQLLRRDLRRGRCRHCAFIGARLADQRQTDEGRSGPAQPPAGAMSPVS
jgi:hypothetical protein